MVTLKDNLYKEKSVQKKSRQKNKGLFEFQVFNGEGGEEFFLHEMEPLWGGWSC